MKKNSGFTLIELVIVIIVLGILSATAVPKFINIQDDARTSALEGVKGSLSSAATLAYSKLAISGLEGKAIVNDEDSLKMFNDCKACVFRYGYPVATKVTLGYLVNGIGSDKNDDFNFYESKTITGGGEGSVKVTFSKDIESLKNVNDDQCYVQYTSYDAKGKPPLVEVVKCS